MDENEKLNDLLYHEVKSILRIFSDVLTNHKYVLHTISHGSISFKNVNHTLIFRYELNQYTLGKSMELNGISLGGDDAELPLVKFITSKNPEFNIYKYLSENREKCLTKKKSFNVLLNDYHSEMVKALPS